MASNQYVMSMKRIFSTIYLQKHLASALALMMVMVLTMAPAKANNYYDDHHGNRRSSSTSQIWKPALVGAGIGAVIGGLTSRGDRSSGLLKGALIGGAAGGVYGYARKKGYLGGRGRNSGYLPYGYSNGYQNSTYANPSYGSYYNSNPRYNYNNPYYY